MARNGWTAERRAKQAEAIRRWQPWLQSTGPTSDDGKARSSRNADKGGKRPSLRKELARLRELMREWQDDMERLG